MKHFPEDLPPGRLKIDRLGTGRGRSGPPPQEERPEPRIERRKQGRRGSTPRDPRE